MTATARKQSAASRTTWERSWKQRDRLRAALLATLPAPCGICGEPVRKGSQWVIGHVIARSERPDLMFELSNVRPEHRRCSNRTGQAQAIANAERRGAQRALEGLNGGAQAETRAETRTDGRALHGFSDDGGAPPQRRSLPSQRQEQADANGGKLAYVDHGLAALVAQSPEIERRPVEPARRHADGFVLPRLESPPRGGTSYELAERALDWIDSHAPGEPLMPWQRYALSRMLELDERGRMWRRVLLLMSRQQGKTYMMRRYLLWRAFDGRQAFGQPQRVMNTAVNYKLADDLLAPWAMMLTPTFGGRSRAYGHACDWWCEGNEEGSTWSSRSLRRGALTGTSHTAAFVDEVQDAPRDVVRRALMPTMSGARVVQPQLVLAGTGARSGPKAEGSEESRLLRELREEALSGGETLLLEWSAPPDAEWSDVEAWRYASPDWSEARAETLREESAADTFGTEYLVIHEEVTGEQADGSAIMPENLWLTARGEKPAGLPVAAAVEAWWEQGCSSALAWMDGERVFVEVEQHASLVEAAQRVSSSGLSRVTVGKSLAADLAFQDFEVETRSMTVRDAAVALRRLVDEERMTHAESGPLWAQLASVRVALSAAGPRLRHAERMDAVKAAVWAVEDAQQAPEPPAIF